MPMITAIISILALGGAAALVRKMTRRNLCPICAGASLTWLWMLVGMWSDRLPTSDFQLPTSILMGGSVVGASYQLAKRLRAGRSPLTWKMLSVPLGFALVWSALQAQIIPAIILAIATTLLAARFVRIAPNHADRTHNNINELEKKMEHCC